MSATTLPWAAHPAAELSDEVRRVIVSVILPRTPALNLALRKPSALPWYHNTRQTCNPHRMNTGYSHASVLRIYCWLWIDLWLNAGVPGEEAGAESALCLWPLVFLKNVW